MVKNYNGIDIRKHGIYYTPDELAFHLAFPLIKKGDASIFDPAYGGGALLLAAEKACKQKSFSLDKLSLFGCDTNPVNGLLKHLPQANLKEEDFFQFSTNHKFQVILTNPPYVRRQNQQIQKINSYREDVTQLNILNNKADLWAYFIVKSISHLKKGGDLGAVLPWSFIQADYAQPLRKWLLNQFESIKILALNNPFFDSAEERVLLVWMEGFGFTTKTIKFANSLDLNKQIKYSCIGEKNFLSKKVLPFKSEQTEKILCQLKKLGFKEFKEVADTKIGIVTGANNFFIKSEQDFSELNITKTKLKPILSGTRELVDYLNNGCENLKRIVCLNQQDYDSVESFIKLGEDSNFHLRAHSKNRSPWYSIKLGKIPDAFFPYRVSTIPYLVVNNKGIQCTNSIHRIYFKNLTITEIKWIHVSILSVYGQLSLEVNAKTYGRGMLKTEPSALGKVMIFMKKDRSVDKIYNVLVKLLSIGEKQRAVTFATDFINHQLNIDTDFSLFCDNILSKIRASKKR